MFKKMIAMILSLLTVLSFTACEPAATQKSGFPIDLTKYTIVYPAEYEPWQLEEVKFLQETVKKVFGVYINAIADTEPEKENEIILASSKRNTAVSAKVAEFTSELDYIIAKDNNDIVLGGKSFYGDLKAIYDFTENYLGYDDINDKILDAVNGDINTEKTVKYAEPKFTTLAGNLGKYPFLNAGDVKTMAEAGFNMVKLDVSKFDIAEFKTYVKWCTRYNVRIIHKTIYNIKTKEFNVNDYEFSSACPIIFGHYARFEFETKAHEMYDEMCTSYKEKYSDIGWKLVLNFYGDITYNEVYAPVFENNELFKDADIISITENLDHGQGDLRVDYSKLDCIEKLCSIARRNGKDIWFTVRYGTGQEPDFAKKISNLNRWNSYMALAFGATGVQYEQYRRGNVVNDDFTKADRYDSIKEINNELLAMADVYSQYEFVGVNVVNQVFEDKFTEIENQTKDFAAITSFTASSSEKPFLFGYFKAKDGSDRYAFVCVDASEVTSGSTVAPASTYTFTKNTVTVYNNGVAEAATYSETAKAYRIRTSNGCGTFVTLE